MTIKLFEGNPYLKECTSNVINIINDNEQILVVLDKTIFFPEGGGQLSDKGWINDAKVEYVFEKDGIIYHQIDKSITGEKANCELDWNIRLDRMQQHCGEHILSGVFLKLYNAHNHGFHMGEDYVTIDIDLKSIDKKMISKVEQESNKAINKNNSINISVVTKDDAIKLPLRKELKVDSDIRIVDINEIDCVACCGTHPHSTSEVGLIKIIKTENYKGMTRVYFKCGIRALKDYQNKHNIVNKLSKLYSTDENSIIEKTKSDIEKSKELIKELKSVKNKLLKYEAIEIIQNDSFNIKKTIDNEDFTLIKVLLKDKSFDDLQLLANTIMENQKSVLFLASKKDNRVLLTHDGSFKLHCGKIYKNNINTYNGRGGGGNKMAQGVFSNSEDLLSFFNNTLII
ncbi:alanyl-tRNA editing protein [Clostridium sediminicola]|uniref:alanyl-tRNA editing protein n=1 Tax=Clostridium sediminicola TaxID=3114879 RepID=UPI0031F269A3